MDTINHVNELFVNYRAIEKLAVRGGFASVYKGKHIFFENRPPVAIKVLHQSLNTENEKNSFMKEAHFLEELKHTYILPVLDAGVTANGLPYIITEYAPEGSLKDRLNKHPGEPLPSDEALRILSQIGQALHHAHQKKYIHRDLKPDNILFKARDQALLADFGIAVEIEKSGPQPAEIVGTPAYMAPEQFESKISTESDQYSLSCIAYELFTGHHPFSDHNLLYYEWWQVHKNQSPRRPSRLNPAIPAHVERAIMKALEKNVVDRYPGIMAFLGALDAPLPQTIGSAAQKKRYSLADTSRQPVRVEANRISTIRMQPAIAELSQVPTSQQTVREYLEKGEALFKQQLFSDALIAFEQATHLDSKSAEAHYHIGQVFEKLGRPWEANAAYDRAIDLNAKFANAYIGKGDIHLSFKHYEEALSDYQRAARVDRKFPRAYFKIGEVLSKLERYHEALSANDSSLRFAPYEVETNQQRVELLQELKRYDEALAHYDTSIKNLPQQVSFYQGKADLLNFLGRHNEALETYDLLIQRMPNMIDPYYSKINLLEFTGQYDEVTAIYDQVIKLTPGRLNVYFDKAAFLKRHRRYDEALAIYDQAIPLTTNPVEIYNKKIEILESPGRSEELLAAYNEVLSCTPDDLQLIHKKITLLEQLKHYDQALETNEQIIRLWPKSTDAFFKKAELLQALDRNADALLTYREITELEPANARAYYNNGKLLAKFGAINKQLVPVPAKYLPRSLQPFIARLFPNAIYLNALSEFETAYQLEKTEDAYGTSLKSTLQALGKFHEANNFDKEDQGWGDRHGHIFWLSLFNVLNVLILSIISGLLLSSLPVFVTGVLTGGMLTGLFAYLLNKSDAPHHLYNALFLCLPSLAFSIGWSYLTWAKTQAFSAGSLVFLLTFFANSLAAVLLDMYGIDLYVQAIESLLSGFFTLIEGYWNSIRELK